MTGCTVGLLFLLRAALSLRQDSTSNHDERVCQ